MLKVNYTLNGKKYTFGLIVKGHPEDRELERARKCSFELIGPTIFKALGDVVRIATSNKEHNEHKEVLIVNEDEGHSVVLIPQLKEKSFVIMTVKTVIDKGKGIFVSKKHKDITEVVKV